MYGPLDRGFQLTLLPDSGIGPVTAPEVGAAAIRMTGEAYRIYDIPLSPTQREALYGGVHP